MLKCEADREEAGQTAQDLAVSALTLHAVVAVAVLVRLGYHVWYFISKGKDPPLPTNILDTVLWYAVAMLSFVACIVAFVMFGYMHDAFGSDIPPYDAENDAKTTYDMGITVMVFSIPYFLFISALVWDLAGSPFAWDLAGCPFILGGPIMLILVAVLVGLMVARSNYWYDPDSEIQDEEC